MVRKLNLAYKRSFFIPDFYLLMQISLCSHECVPIMTSDGILSTTPGISVSAFITQKRVSVSFSENFFKYFQEVLQVERKWGKVEEEKERELDGISVVNIPHLCERKSLQKSLFCLCALFKQIITKIWQ